MSYGKIKETFWTDEKVASWPNEAKLLALYLLSGPHRNMLGCVRVPAGYIQADLGWAEPMLAEAMAWLEDQAFIVRDGRTGWTLIVNQLRHDPPQNRNHGLAMIALADAVPSGCVRDALMPRLDAALKGIGMAYQCRRDAVETPSKGHVEAVATPEPLPEPLPEPEPKKVEGAQERAPRATRLALDTLPDDWRAYCVENHPDLNPEAMWHEFHDYWKACGGGKARKVDWLATWRMWLRRARDFRSGNGRNQGDRPSRGQLLAAEALALGERLDRDSELRQRSGPRNE